VALTSGWLGDPEATAQASAHPEVFAHKSIDQVAGHFAAIIASLARSR
jgi:non-heme chloroperoxidase